MARKKHGPGFWLCWTCANLITDDPRFDSSWWIPLPSGYRSKGGRCRSCKRIVLKGERCAKVMLEAEALLPS